MTEQGSWIESKLFVFRELERHEEEVRRLIGQIAVNKETIEGRFKRDLDIAHQKIRGLEISAAALDGAIKLQISRVKLWATGAAAAFLATIVFTLLRYLLKVG